MRQYPKLALTALFVAVSLILASCGAGGGAGDGGADGGGMKGMDHGQSKKDEGSMKGMDHGSGDMASGMLMKNGKYSDERFIDAMVPHHEGAVQTAQVALKNAEHPEIRQTTENIVSSQEAEIKELKSIKQEEFGTSKVPMDMGIGQMKGMGMMADPQSLADKDPFDKAFINAMIPHHRSVIDMARVARQKTDNPKVRKLATDIVSAQREEISQMRQWREE